MKDPGLLCSAGDLIDNAVFVAIESMSFGALEWDMEIIGEVENCIEHILNERGLRFCRPWENEDETICYATDERCPWCVRGKKGERK